MLLSRVIELLRLEKNLKAIKTNPQPRMAKVTPKPCP